MSVTTISSREFNQDSGKAKKSAQDGPVIVTDRGEPSYVLMTYDEYVALTQDGRNIGDMLAMSPIGDDDFEPPKIDRISKDVDLS